MRVITGIMFVLTATSLLCWFSTSDLWIFDPLTGGLVFFGSILFIAYFGFITIEGA